MPQLEDDIDNFILHWSANVRDYLDEQLLHRRIERAVDYNMPLTQWPSRSPNLTLCDFFLCVCGWGHLKDEVLVLPLPVDLEELKQHITIAIDRRDSDILTSIQAEMDYRLNVCRGQRVRT
ncbi:uncharacterized protein TNCV_946751 [Trichonephila clavipes]|nr:uncharacterized protein TNCV_946751 [Trichonephila clavipes]